MQKKELKYSVRRLLEHIKTNASKTGDEEAIHQLRVAYKKLRTLLRVARLERRTGILRIPTELRTLYGLAGELRNLQIYRKHIIAFFLNDTYPENVDQKIIASQEQLLEFVKVLNVEACREQIERHLPKSLSQRSVKKFLRKKAHSIRKMRDCEGSDNDLHYLRKLTKDIAYSLEETDVKARKYFPLAGMKNMAELKKFSDTLGNYQDIVTNLAILDGADASLLTEQDKTVLGGLRKEWEMRKTDMKKELLPL